MDFRFKSLPGKNTFESLSLSQEEKLRLAGILLEDFLEKYEESGDVYLRLNKSLRNLKNTYKTIYPEVMREIVAKKLLSFNLEKLQEDISERVSKCLEVSDAENSLAHMERLLGKLENIL